MVNQLARLGWSSGDEEIFSIEELIAKFDLDRVNKSAAIFDQTKMLWLNAHYIKSEPAEKLAPLLIPFLDDMGYKISDVNWLAKAVKTLQQRSKTLVDMAQAAEFYLKDKISYDPKLAKKFLSADKHGLLILLKDKLSAVNCFDEDNLINALDEIMKEHNLKLKDIAQPLRVALTGSKVSPGIYETMEVLGKDKVIERIEAACMYTEIAAGN